MKTIPLTSQELFGFSSNQAQEFQASKSGMNWTPIILASVILFIMGLTLWSRQEKIINELAQKKSKTT
ncbi:MAG TPA: hypothetical protein PKH65_02880 [Bacteroidia bacterium]|nr:hypothetical protein [Bacteroidia bacterium]